MAMIQRKGMDIFKIFKQRFQCDVSRNRKNARIKKYVCFIALTLAWSLGKCLKTQPDGFLFSFLRTQRILMDEKTRRISAKEHVKQLFKFNAMQLHVITS